MRTSHPRPANQGERARGGDKSKGGHMDRDIPPEARMLGYVLIVVILGIFAGIVWWLLTL